MVEDTYWTEWIPFIIRVWKCNNSNPMRQALIQSTDLKCHGDLFHVIKVCVLMIFFVWMKHFILKILFKLPVTLVERIEVVDEREHLVKVLRWFISFNLVLFYFFFLSVTDKIFSTKIINRLSCFKVRNLSINFEESFLKRFWRTFEFLYYILWIAAISVSLIGQLNDRFLDFIKDLELFGYWGHWFNYLFCLRTSPLFVARNSDIEGLKQVREDLVEV